ncbi:helix-turn-helix transcriptional regulator [Micromonospora sp. NPDC000207]|uniref:helix-turn-helix domain-containing protein n=1 Tax=Micromonospora sp. NPDC000207 TaxID=3154246 RepID=UPI003321B51B
MSYLYDRLTATRQGSRALSAARLRYQVLKALHRALANSGSTQSELAARLGVRKSAVNQVLRGDGNVRVSTLGEYLHELGVELSIETLPLGTQRASAEAEMSRQRLRRATLRPEPARQSATTCNFDQLDWHTGPAHKVLISAGNKG